jgi:hypothetical protein
LLGEGFESLVVETAAGTIFKGGEKPSGASRLKQEAILLDELAPRLPIAIPAPRWSLFDAAAWPYALLGYEKVPGSPLRSEHLTLERATRLGGEVGRFRGSARDQGP